MIWLFSWRGQTFIFKRLSSVLRLQRCHFLLSAEVTLLSHFFEHAQNGRGWSRKSQYCFLFLILSSRSIFSFLWLMQSRVYPAPGSNGGWGRHGNTNTKNIATIASGVFIDLMLNSVWPLNFIVNVMPVGSLTTCGAPAHKIEVISTDNLALNQHYAQ